MKIDLEGTNKGTVVYPGKIVREGATPQNGNTVFVDKSSSIPKGYLDIDKIISKDLAGNN